MIELAGRHEQDWRIGKLQLKYGSHYMIHLVMMVMVAMDTQNKMHGTRVKIELSDSGHRHVGNVLLYRDRVLPFVSITGPRMWLCMCLAHTLSRHIGRRRCDSNRRRKERERKKAICLTRLFRIITMLVSILLPIVVVVRSICSHVYLIAHWKSKLSKAMVNLNRRASHLPLASWINISLLEECLLPC